MTSLLLAALCLSPPKLEGFSRPLTIHDKAAIKSAQKRCPELFKESPCVSRIIKMDAQDYRVICGKSKQTRTI